MLDLFGLEIVRSAAWVAGQSETNQVLTLGRPVGNECDATGWLAGSITPPTHPGAEAEPGAGAPTDFHSCFASCLASSTHADNSIERLREEMGSTAEPAFRHAPFPPAHDAPQLRPQTGALPRASHPSPPARTARPSRTESAGRARTVAHTRPVTGPVGRDAREGVEAALRSVSGWRGDV
ncbi:hypothetical protein K3495_g6873 [Podosphaera aphanis]|nr:hypothetical protein K3495_g6873 [Podosphaera aphanis]